MAFNWKIIGTEHLMSRTFSCQPSIQYIFDRNLIKRNCNLLQKLQDNLYNYFLLSINLVLQTFLRSSHLVASCKNIMTFNKYKTSWYFFLHVHMVFWLIACVGSLIKCTHIFHPCMMNYFHILKAHISSFEKNLQNIRQNQQRLIENGYVILVS